MDDQRFDTLARALANGSSRRSVLKGLLGIGGGAAVAAVSSGVADARRRGSSSTPTTTPEPTTTTEAPAICDGTPCGLDCCDSPEQCCDSECCPAGHTCTSEEWCCRNDLVCPVDMAGCCAEGQSCCELDGCCDTICCNGSCLPPGACCGDGDCGPCEQCIDNACTSYCPEGLVCCADQVSCGIADFDSGRQCTANTDCCSGICQGGLCVPTIAGTCDAAADQCTRPDNTECAEFCFCRQSISQGVVCSNLVACVDSCGDCPTGTICSPGSTSNCCGGSFQCLLPCPPQGGDCFVAGTRIAMADGSTRPIETLAVGDLVLGADGIVNTVTGNRSPRLGERRLYAFNGGDAFVTASHPFWTDSGWKSFDPAATRISQPDLDVGMLTIGDRLHQLSGVLAVAGIGLSPGRGACEMETEPVLLGHIAEVSADPDTPLYTLTLKGNHSYFANELLVHNKA